MNKGFALAIDGPVASGKGTIASALAKKIGGIFVNTGAMYRCVALKCLEQNVDVHNEEEVAKIMPGVDITLSENKVFLDKKDVTQRITEPDIASMSSIVASYPEVRKDLVAKQQKLASAEISKGQIIIMEGRDIGTRVLPDADVKIFLTADSDTRAKRRLEQFAEKNITKTLDEVLDETRKRDKLDTEREVDPLPSNPEEYGYFVLNNSNQSEEESVSTILGELIKRGLIKNDSL